MKLTETREQNRKVEKEGAGKCGGMWGRSSNRCAIFNMSRVSQTGVRAGLPVPSDQNN